MFKQSDSLLNTYMYRFHTINDLDKQPCVQCQYNKHWINNSHLKFTINQITILAYEIV